MAIAALSGWTSEQKHVVAASFLGWWLDAFDFFLLVFVLKDIAAEFHTDISNVTLAILLTLAMRPIGAFIFERAADRWGRRPILMIDILLMIVNGGMGTLYGAVVGAIVVVLAEYYLQNALGAMSGAISGMPVMSALFHPDRWLLWLGILFVLIVTFLPQGIVGRLRRRR